MEEELDCPNHRYEESAPRDHPGQSIDLLAVAQSIHGKQRNSGDSEQDQKPPIRLCGLERSEYALFAIRPAEHDDPEIGEQGEPHGVRRVRTWFYEHEA